MGPLEPFHAMASRTWAPGLVYRPALHSEVLAREQRATGGTTSRSRDALRACGMAEPAGMVLVGSYWWTTCLRSPVVCAQTSGTDDMDMSRAYIF